MEERVPFFISALLTILFWATSCSPTAPSMDKKDFSNQNTESAPCEEYYESEFHFYAPDGSVQTKEIWNIANAAADGRLDCVQLALENGDSVDSFDNSKTSFNPLQNAVRNGDSELVGFLIRNEANLAITPGFNSATLVDLAIDAHEYDMAADLVSKWGLSIETGQPEFGSLFQQSVWRGNRAETDENAENKRLAFLKLILNTDLSQRESVDDCGLRPLHFAAALSTPQVLSYVIDTAPHPTELNFRVPPVPNNDFCRKKDSQDTTHPQRLEAKEGYTALHYAAEEGNLENTRSLVSAGARPGIPDIDGRTALEVATEGGFSELQSYLMSLTH